MKDSSLIPKINLSTSEAAHYLGIPKSELAGSRCSGSLRGLIPPNFIRLGRAVRYPKLNLDEWNKSQPIYTTNAQAENAIGSAYPVKHK